MIIKKHIYGRRPIPPNTFIGGVGSSLSTKNVLATKLGIAPTRIKSFRIVNDEVQAFIKGAYEIMTNTFMDDHTITHYKDNDRLVKRINNGAFANCSNLETLELYGVLDMSSGGSSKISNTKVVHLYFPEMNSISGNISIENNLLLKTFDAPIATLIPQNSVLRNNPSLEYINIPNVKSQIGFTVLNNNTFDGCKVGCVINVHSSMMSINGGLPDADLYSNTNLDVNYLDYVSDSNNCNTFIGGLGSTAWTRFSLAQKLGIGSARIIDLFSNGVNVKLNILGDFEFKANVFSGDNELTYLINSGNFFRPSTDGFNNTTKIKALSIYGDRTSFRVAQNSSIKYLFFGQATTLYGYRCLSFMTNTRIYLGQITNALTITNDSNNPWMGTTNCKVYVHQNYINNTTLVTAYNRAISHGNTVVVVDNYDIPNSIDDLEINEIVGSSVRFNFTEIPNAEFYEVWIKKDSDEVFYQIGEITSLGDSFNFEPQTNYTIKLATCDEFWNGSGHFLDQSKRAFSNEVSFTTL